MTNDICVTNAAFTYLVDGGAALVLGEPFLVPNFSCLRRTSRGGLATELTKAILTCRPVKVNNIGKKLSL